MNEELLKLLQGLDERFKDADKTSKYFSANPEKYDVAVDMLRKKYKPEADSAKFRSYFDGKYGNPFAQQEPAPAAPIPAEPVAPSITEQPAPALPTSIAEAYQGMIPEQIGGFNQGRPVIGPEVNIVAPDMPEGTAEGAMQSYAPGTAPQGFGFENTPIAETPKQEPLADLHWTSDIKNTVGAFNHAVLNALPAFAETIAATANKIDDTVGPENDKNTEDYATYKAAQWMRGKIKELLPVDEAYQQELAPQIAGGLGQVATIMLAAGTGNAPAALEQLGAKSPGLLPAITDAAAKLSAAMLSKGGAVAGTQVFANEFREAKQAGADDDTAFESGVKNAIVSSGLEQLPVLNALKRFNKGTGGGVVNWLKETAFEASEEMVTEVASQFYANLNAQQTYDKNRSLIDGLKESGEAGYGTGFVLNGILNALGVRMRNAHTVEEKKIIKTAIDETMAELETAADPAALVDEQGRPYTVRQEPDGMETKVYKLDETDSGKPSGGSKSSSRQGGEVYLAKDVEGVSQKKAVTKEGIERPYTVTENEPDLDKGSVRDLGAWQAVKDKNGKTTYIPTPRAEAQGANPEPASRAGEVAGAGDGADSRPAETAAAQPEAAGAEPEIPGAEPDNQADRELVADTKTTYVSPYFEGVMDEPQSEQEKMFIVDEQTGAFRVNPDKVDLFLSSVDTHDYVGGNLTGKDARQAALAMVGRLEKSGKGWKVAEKLSKPKPEPVTPIQETEVEPTPVVADDPVSKQVLEGSQATTVPDLASADKSTVTAAVGDSIDALRKAKSGLFLVDGKAEGVVAALLDFKKYGNQEVDAMIDYLVEWAGKVDDVRTARDNEFSSTPERVKSFAERFEAGYFKDPVARKQHHEESEKRKKLYNLATIGTKQYLEELDLFANLMAKRFTNRSFSTKDSGFVGVQVTGRDIEDIRGDAQAAIEGADTQQRSLPESASSSEVKQQPNVKESFTVGSAAYSVVKDGDGYTITNTATGKVLDNPRSANYKSAIKQYEGKRQEERTQQRRNTIVTSVQALNEELKGTKPQEQKARKRFVELSAEADKAGLDLKENKKQGRFELFDRATGKKVAVKNTDTPTSENPKGVPLQNRSQEVQDFVRKALPRIKENPVAMQGMGLSFHRDSDIKGAASDIEAGKNTNRANELLDKLEQSVSQGFIGRDINVGGGRFDRGTESLEDFLAEGAGKPISGLDDDTLSRLIDSNSEIRSMLELDGLYNEDHSVNYDKLSELIEQEGKGYFTAFPYALSDSEFKQLQNIANERKTKPEAATDQAGADTAPAQSEQSDRGGQGESQAAEVTAASGKKVSFTFHDGTKRIGTVTDKNQDGTVNIKGENGRSYPSVDGRSIDADLPAQTARTFAPIGVTMPSLTGSSSGRIQPSPIIGERPKPLREIMLDMSKATRGKLSYSKQPGRRRSLGTYNPRNAAVKIRYKNDLDTTAHELGHSLDDQYGLLQGIPAAQEAVLHNELMQLAPGGSTPPKGHPDPKQYELGEGVAEFIRGYIVHPEQARMRAPEFTAWFESTVPAATRKMVDGFSEDIRVFIGASAHDAIMANVDMQLEKGKGSVFASPERGRFGITWYDKLVTGWADSLQPLKKSILFARTERGMGALRPSKDPYTLAENLAGHNDKLSRIFEGGLVNAKLEVVKDQVSDQPMTMRWLFEGLDSSDKATLEREQQEVVSYMVAERTLELIDKRVEQDIDAALKNGNYVDGSIIASNPRLQHLARLNADNQAAAGAKLKKINTSDAAIVTGIGGGVVKDADQARRRLDDMEQLRQSDPEKHARIKEAARRYQAYADQVLQYAVDKGRMSQEQYDAIKRYNTQYVALNRILEAGPEEEIVVHQGNGSSLASAKGVADKRIKGSGATIKNPYVSLLDFVNKTVEESDRNEFKLAFRDLFKGDRDMYSGEQEALAQVARPAAQGDKNTIKIFVDGKPEYWQLQEDLYKTFTGFDNAGGSSYLVQALSPVASLVRWTVTHSPVFALRNKVRDMQNWLVISKSGPHRAFSFNKATKQENRRRYELFGGGQGGYYLKDENFYYTQMEMAMEDMAKSKDFILVNPQRLLSRGWEKYKSLLSESETSTRLLEFNAAFKKAKQEGMDDYDAATYAAHEARDLMNFARAGNIAREVNKVIPFLNAAIQGLRKTVRTAKENPGGMTVRWAAFLALPAVLNRMIISSFGEEEEEEYQKMPAYQRDLFYNFPVGDNKWLAIPKPFEIGVLASGVERLLDKAYYGNEKAFEGYAGSVARTTMPVDESAIAGPLRSLVEVSANYDFFKQKAIVSPYERDKAVELRSGTERASALGQVLQKAFGNSIDSRYIDHLISANTTYFGNWTMKLSDEIAGTENNAKGFNLSDTGFIKQDPVYNSRDVQWVLEQANELGLAQSKDMRELNRLLGEQFEAEDAKDKDAKGKVVREYAGRLRSYWESTNAEAVVMKGEKVKKMPKPTASR